MLMVVGMYLLLGMVMDQMAIIILTAPVTHALMTGLGYDEIWSFGFPVDPVLLVRTYEHFEAGLVVLGCRRFFRGWLTPPQPALSG